MSGFWGHLFYWVIVLSLAAIVWLLVVVLRDVQRKYRLVRAPGKMAPEGAEPFCGPVDVALQGAALVSPLVQVPCLYYSSSVIKHYTGKRRETYLETSAQADYLLRLGDLRVLPPDHDSATFVKREYQYHKSWLSGSLPERLERNLRRLDLDEAFWTGHRRTTIDFAEGVLPVRNQLWVYGCVKPEAAQNDTLRLVGTAEGQQPVVAVSHEDLKHWSRYALISQTTATIGVAIFAVVTAYVLR